MIPTDSRTHRSSQFVNSYYLMAPDTEAATTTMSQQFNLDEKQRLIQAMNAQQTGPGSRQGQDEAPLIDDDDNGIKVPITHGFMSAKPDGVIGQGVCGNSGTNFRALSLY
ncbi:hypothetical protein ONZ43_g3217 [Nemania bipapillata]|uniref:Uncharacterized protein n=1 Tax=Nemania bipapillata TaxID=110536 RepID=A0ACC2IXN3_9PEZI|nr:hypothetical protein ONZ43_g3217 [Nemania bipapillata]